MIFVFEDGDSIAKLSYRGVQSKFPNVSFPREPSAAVLADFNVFPLEYDTKPSNDIIEEGPIEKRGDRYFQTYTGRDYTSEEIRSRMVVSLLQARTALAEAGVLDQILAAVELIPEPSRTRAKVALEYSTTVERTSPLIDLVRTQIGWTDEQMDDLFVAAAAIE